MVRPTRGRHQAEQHRTPIPGVEAITLRSDRAFPRHAHDTFGIGVIDGGGHRSWSGRGPVEACPGDCIAVNPGEVHDGQPIGGAARSWRMLHLDPTVVAALDPDQNGGFEFARPSFSDPLLASRFRAAHCSLSEASADPMAAEEALLHLMEALLDRHGRCGRVRPRLSPSIARAIARIEDAPERPVTLAELAAIAGLGRFQLLRAFARETGLTPHAYRLQRRVRLARLALGRGETPAEAALLAGFADQSHLTRAFGRQYGTTPARYRTAVAPRPQ